MKNIVIVAANHVSRCVEQIKSRDDYTFHYLDLEYSSRDNLFNFDILAYLENARDYIKKHDIDGVFYHLDIGALIAAQLCEEFNLPGPSLESIFLAYHKYYTRVTTDHDITFDYFDINAPKSDSIDFPFYLKAPCSSLGTLGYVIENEHDFQDKMNIVRAQLPHMTKAVMPLFQKYINLDKYPLAKKQIMIVEPLIVGFQITIEGFVHDGQIYFTVIADTNNFAHSKKIDNFSIPSRLSPETQEKIKEKAKKDIQAIGLQNSFFNCEYWVGDKITLIEINGRAAAAFHNLYKKVYNYDVFEAGIQLCLGKKPDVTLVQQCVGGQCNIITEQEGNSSSMIHYGKLPTACTMFIKPNSHVTQFSEYGRVIAQVELFGGSYAEIKQSADQIRKKVMKQALI